MLLGLHLSVRQGALAALEEAERLGLGVFQILPYRRHAWPTPAELQSFREARARSKVRRVIVHSRFVPAPASSDSERRGASVRWLTKELACAEGLGADAFVLHPGAFSPDSDLDEGIRLLARTVEAARLESGARLQLIIENVPGGGRRMGGSLEELARILEAVRAVWPGAACCLDTAHAWGAGYPLERRGGMLDFLADAERALGPEAVALWHVNDSRAAAGSRLDDHWHLGQGRIGPEGLSALSAALGETDAAAILETPRGDLDLRNLEWMASAGRR